MDSKKKESVEKIEPQIENVIQNRIKLQKVIIDTPALLNLIKNCQDSKWIPTNAERLTSKASGLIMGVLKRDIDENNLFITSIQIKEFEQKINISQD